MARKNHDQYQKILRIGVRYNGQTFELLDGKPLPRLRPGFVELVISPEMIESSNDRAMLMREIYQLLLPKGSIVMIGVSPNMIGPEEGLIHHSTLRLACEYLLAEVQLEEDLLLKVRGDEQARLANCKCTIKALKKEAKSLNHAFTIISEHYEIRRLAHTANVFQRTWTQLKGKWWLLDDLRRAILLTENTRAASSV